MKQQVLQNIWGPDPKRTRRLKKEERKVKLTPHEGRLNAKRGMEKGMPVIVDLR